MTIDGTKQRNNNAKQKYKPFMSNSSLGFFLTFFSFNFAATRQKYPNKNMKRFIIMLKKKAVTSTPYKPTMFLSSIPKGAYAFASVSVACFTYILKGDSLSLGKNGLNIESKLDEQYNKIINKIDTQFVTLQGNLNRTDDNLKRLDVDLKDWGSRIQERDMEGVRTRNIGAIDIIVKKTHCVITED
jgi:hypothetical protein